MTLLKALIAAILGYWRGRAAVESEDKERDDEAEKRIAAAEAGAPRDRTELADRLRRDKGF